MTRSRDRNALEHVGCQRLRVGSKKSVQQGRESLARSRRGHPLFCARSVHLVREHGKMVRTPLDGLFSTDPYKDSSPTHRLKDKSSPVSFSFFSLFN